MIHCGEYALTNKENIMYSFKHLSIGEADASILVFSQEEAEEDGLSSWSLAQLRSQQDTYENSAFASMLSQRLSAHDIFSVYAPSVAPANAQIIHAGVLSTAIRLPGIFVYRNPACPADGIILNAGQTFMVSAAGCPIIMANAGPYLIVAHAGRDSLIDRGAVMGAPSRKYFGVVEAILDVFKKAGISAYEDPVLHLLFALPARSFEHRADHAQYGMFNRALISFAEERWPGSILREDGSTFLDLEAVFIAQAQQAGIRTISVSHSLEEYPDLAHTRDGKGSARRNLIVVKRHD